MIDDNQLNIIAKTVHESMRAWIAANDETPPAAWDDAADWMRQSSRDSVIFAIANPDTPVSAQHDQWLEQKKKDGWVYGPVKDEAKKTHPMMVPFRDLPDYEKRKDAIVKALSLALTEKMS